MSWTFRVSGLRSKCCTLLHISLFEFLRRLDFLKFLSKLRRNQLNFTAQILDSEMCKRHLQDNQSTWKKTLRMATQFTTTPKRIHLETKPALLGNSSLTSSVIGRDFVSYGDRYVTVTNCSTTNTSSLSLASQLHNKTNHLHAEKKFNNQAMHPFVEHVLRIRLTSTFV